MTIALDINYHIFSIDQKVFLLGVIMKLKVEGKKCMGCRICQMACCLEHFDYINPKKAAIFIKSKFPEPGEYVPIVCDQCGVCASVCPSEAIEKINGYYKIDKDKCSGCQICVNECPSHAMYVHEDSIVPIKCDMCEECIEMCPTKVFSKVQ